MDTPTTIVDTPPAPACLADDWLRDHYDYFTGDGGWPAFISETQKSFETHISRIGDCFVDTAVWAKENSIDQEELEQAIVELVSKEFENLTTQKHSLKGPR